MSLTFDQAIHTITDLLAQAATLPTSGNLEAVQASHRLRSQLAHHLGILESHVSALSQQIQGLPRLAQLGDVEWAMQQLTSPHTLILEVDTTGLSPATSEVLRIVLLDTKGAPILDVLISPTHPIDTHITHLTGIDQRLMDERGVPGQQALAQFSEVLYARMLLSFNLEFDKKHLQALASQMGVALPPLVGHCLMEQAAHYFQIYRYQKLEHLCQRIGTPLPERPHQNALDRARGQLALLRAMANGVLDTPIPELVLSDDADLWQEDEQPF
jgi:DNA polymerase III epsilon subunit-like protein